MADILENGSGVRARLLFSEISIGHDKEKKKKKLKAQTVYNPMYILKDVLVSIYIVGQIFILWEWKEEKDSECKVVAFVIMTNHLHLNAQQ